MEQNGPVNLFRFVINPNDFAQSVENLFYLSFLIRDGECALEMEEDGEPVICTFSLSLSFALRLISPQMCIDTGTFELEPHHPTFSPH
jgi:hypothetical protein